MEGGEARGFWINQGFVIRFQEEKLINPLNYLLEEFPYLSAQDIVKMCLMIGAERLTKMREHMKNQDINSLIAAPPLNPPPRPDYLPIPPPPRGMTIVRSTKPCNESNDDDFFNAGFE